MKLEYKPINKLCILAVDCVNKTAPIVEYETPYKMIRTTNVKNGFIDLETVRYVEKKIFEKWTRRSKPKYGDVILTREAPVGSVGRFTSNDKNVFLGQRLFHYRPNPKLLDWNYLAYILQSESLQGWLHGIAFGATVPHVTVADAEKIKIPYRSIDIQKKIGKILSNYDDLIENNLKRIKLLEESAKLTYEEWFLRFRIDGKKLDIDSETGLPFGWEKKSITDFKSFQQDKSKVKKFDGEKRYLATADIDKTFIVSDGEMITWENKPSRAQIVPSKHSVWFARMSNTYKVLCITSKDEKLQDNIVISSGFAGFKTKSALYLPFLYYTINSKLFHELKDLYSTGATQVSLTNESMKFIKLIEPDINTIKNFGKLILPIIDNISILGQQNNLLKEARDILLPRLMTDKIDVENLEVKL